MGAQENSDVLSGNTKGWRLHEDNELSFGQTACNEVTDIQMEVPINIALVQSLSSTPSVCLPSSFFLFKEN